MNMRPGEAPRIYEPFSRRIAQDRPTTGPTQALEQAVLMHTQESRQKEPDARQRSTVLGLWKTCG